MYHAEVGARVRSQLGSRQQQEVAAVVGMTPDAFSRALSGKRAFSSLELVRLADELGQDVHWLITGEADPNRFAVAARHDFDFESGRRQVPGREADESVLRDIGLAYQQAYEGIPPEVLRPLPDGLEKARAALGDGFIRPFADRLESVLGIHVVRVKELSTSYCFTIAERHVIAIPATGNWFRENFSLAHELGHLVARHLDAAQRADHEAQANSFAAQLLMPASLMHEIDWTALSSTELAQWIWDLGVSTDSLAIRLSALGVPVSANVAALLGQSTQKVLRHHWIGDRSPQPAFVDAITHRMEMAATRRFPTELQEAHLDKIATGALGKGTLAWMLGIDADELEVEMPVEAEDLAELSTDALAAALGL